MMYWKDKTFLYIIYLENVVFSFSPGGFAPLSTRESGLVRLP